jgi:hypothetical protein
LEELPISPLNFGWRFLDENPKTSSGHNSFKNSPVLGYNMFLESLLKIPCCGYIKKSINKKFKTCHTVLNYGVNLRMSIAWKAK